MNAADDGEENPELLSPGSAGLPLSAPVAGDVLQTRRLDIPRQEPAERLSLGYRYMASPTAPVPDTPRHPAARPAAPDPRVTASPPAGASSGGTAQAGGTAAGGTARGGATGGSSADPPEDPQRTRIREQLDELRVRAASASSWLETSVHYARLTNRDGVVPVTVRFSRDDIEFLGQAREEVLGFAELGIRLLELHAPLDAGGISTDPSSPILRCRSCMWRWPCPTFRTLTDALSHLPGPGRPRSR